MEQNLQRVWVKWGWLTKIFGREGVDKRKAGRFYVTVVQAGLLFGYKTWVLTPQLEKALKGFHQQAERRMAGMGYKHQKDGTWV